MRNCICALVSIICLVWWQPHTLVAGPAAQAAGPVQPVDVLLRDATHRAVREDKTVFAVFGASWCTPCRELDAFLNSPETQNVFARHLVVLHITVWEQDAKLNNPGGEELLHKWGANGIPLAAFVDSSGQKIGAWDFDSTDRGTTRRELVSLLAQSAPRMTAAELSAVLMDLRNGRGVIAGRVSDETHQPVAHADVSLVRGTYQAGGQWTPLWGPRAKTDESGRYVFDDVAPGEYRVLVEAGTRAGVASGNLRPRREENGVDVQVSPFRFAVVSGLVTASDGKLSPGTAVTLTSLDRPKSSYQTRTALDGTFSVKGVSPGRYIVRVPIMASATSRGPVETGIQPVLVVGTDITGLQVATKQCAILSGTVSWEGGTISAANRARIRVTGNASESEMEDPSLTAAVSADGRFRMGSVIGPQIIRVENLPASWVLKSVRLNGHDVTNTSVDFTGMGTVSGISIVLARR